MSILMIVFLAICSVVVGVALGFCFWRLLYGREHCGAIQRQRLANMRPSRRRNTYDLADAWRYSGKVGRDGTKTSS